MSTMDLKYNINKAIPQIKRLVVSKAAPSNYDSDTY